MTNNVYANGREIACKAGGGKTIAAFPDVCLSPPSPPAGPIPIPYPNTATDDDTTNGSKTVEISGQEVMLKDSSTFKKSTGDEAATKSLGMGVVTHQITGEASFISWSMDVKFEGANVDRHLDMTVHNEQCMPAQTPPMSFLKRMTMAKGLKNCSDERDAAKDRDNCKPDKKGKVPCPDGSKVDEARAMKKGDPAKPKALKAAYADYRNKIQANKCHKALRCVLSPWKPSRCCKPQTPHHLVPKASFYDPTFESGKKITSGGPGCSGYEPDSAPCICAEGGKTTGSHGLLHKKHRDLTKQNLGLNAGDRIPDDARLTCAQAENLAAESAAAVFPGCSKECIKAQLRREHQKMGITPGQKIKPVVEGPSLR